MMLVPRGLKMRHISFPAIVRFVRCSLAKHFTELTFSKVLHDNLEKISQIIMVACLLKFASSTIVFDSILMTRT